MEGLSENPERHRRHRGAVSNPLAQDFQTFLPLRPMCRSASRTRRSASSRKTSRITFHECCVWHLVTVLLSFTDPCDEPKSFLTFCQRCITLLDTIAKVLPPPHCLRARLHTQMTKEISYNYYYRRVYYSYIYVYIYILPSLMVTFTVCETCYIVRILCNRIV